MMRHKPKEVVEILKERSRVDKHSGMGGHDVRIDKEVLGEACAYLEFYRKMAHGKV